MRNKIAVITGATGGIGIEVCKYLLQNGYTILAAYRNEVKREQAREAIEKAAPEANKPDLRFLHMDMLSFRSVDSFIREVINYLNETGDRIDILINNAGIIAPRFELTPDGYETSLQVNYLSAKRLTENLLPHMQESGRIINTVSCTIHVGRPDPAYEKSPGEQKKEFISLRNYSNSKLLLALYTLDLYQRFPALFICAADPGIVDTGIITMHRWYDPLADLIFRPFIKQAAKGALPLIRAVGYTGPLTDDGPTLFKGKKQTAFPRKIIRLADRLMHP